MEDPFLLIRNSESLSFADETHEKLRNIHMDVSQRCVTRACHEMECSTVRYLNFDCSSSAVTNLQPSQIPISSDSSRYHHCDRPDHWNFKTTTAKACQQRIPLRINWESATTQEQI
ncbi:hypothetical protein R1flu_021898 [Riccia fluitans]|uniref:Uncharacterized protein n=1 Tax=Riccia fluitans TaxID=41844 RepID=A0ABD1ZR14_9MARC